MKTAVKRQQHLKIMVGWMLIALLFPGCSLWENSPQTQNSYNRISQDSLQQFMSSVRSKNSGDAESHYELGRHFQSRGKYAMALKEFWQAASINPEQPEYYNAIGVCYDSLKEYSLAVMSYRWALDLEPDFSEAHNNLGYSYYLQGDLKLARTELMKAVSLDVSNPRYLNNLSLCYKQAVDKNLLLELATANTPATPPSAPVVSPREKIVIADTSDEITNETVGSRDSNSDADLPTEARSAAVPAIRTEIADAGRVESTVIAVNSSGQATSQTISTPPLIEISNGNGAYRMATNMGRYFRAKGFKVVQLTNADNFNHKDTSISYGTGCRNSADYMAELIFGAGYSDESVKNGNAEGKIRIVIGKDIENLNQIFAGELPVVVANGNGVRGMAGRVSRVLDQKGFKLMRPVNAEHFNYEETCIFYPDGRLACAEFVAREIPGQIKIKYATQDSNMDNIKIVIGKDLYI